MKRKFLSILLTLAMALTLLPTAAMAEGDSETPAGGEPTPVEAPAATKVAKVGETEYATLAEAVDAAKDGETVTLLADVTELETISITGGKKVDLNLNEKNITFKADNYFLVDNGALNVTGKGNITSSHGNDDNTWLPTIFAYGTSTDTADYSVVTIGKDVVIDNQGSYGLAIWHKDYKAYGAKVIVEGTVKSTYGFTVTGNAKATQGNIPEITVTESGKIVSADGAAIYAAGYGTYNIAGTLSGTEFGIEIRAGKLNVVDTAKISATGNFSDPVPNGNGSTVTGAAIAVSQHTTNLPIDVNIKGGEISETGTNGHALYEIDTVKDEKAENVAKDVSITVSGGSFNGNVYSTNNKLSISGGAFTDLANAVKYAADGATIKLADDVNGQVVIPAGKSITLDLNGHKVTAPTDGKYDAIINNGTLTVTDSKKTGEIYSGKNAGIGVGANSTTTIEYAKVTGQEGAIGGDKTVVGATVTIKDGVFTGIDNAVVIFNGTKREGGANEITINGGTFNGTIQSSGYVACGIYAPWKDNITVNGGTFNITGGAGIVARGGQVTVNGGVFNTTGNVTGKVGDSRVVVPCAALVFDSEAGYPGMSDDSKISVTGGNFKSDVDAVQVIQKEDDSNKRIAISGGYFTSDPSAYLAAGKGLVTSDQSAFAYKVGDRDTDVETAVTAGEATVTIPADVSGITEDTVKDAANAADTTKTLTDTVAASGMTNDPAVVGTKKAAETALTAKGIPVNSGDTVTVVVQPYLEVNVKSADAGKLTLEISAKYNVVATTGDPVTINLARTATLKSGVPLSINKPIALTIALPTGFATASSIYVQHKGYEYTATVNASGATATFINPHGFSTFTVTPTASAIAEVDGTSYTDLQKAVDAVANNGTITLLNDTSASAVVSRAVKFTLDKNSKSFTGAITAGSGYNLSVDGDVYTFTVRSSSGSSGSSGGSSSSSRRYDVSAPSVKHGDVTVSPKSASKGDTVTITVKPDSGYELDTLTVKDASGSKIKVKDKGDGKFTFTMPASKVTVSAEFAEIETLDFADVSTDAYYYEAVKWAAKKGITGGTGDGTFNPNGSCTRAHIVTFLWRAAGSPAPKSTVSFADVPAGSYYAKAVAWAVENGITLGTGDGTFSPNATCTRAQSVTFLYRALGTAPTTVNGFTDVTADAFYADAVAWAVESGVTNGTSASTFSPNNGCTRAQIVTFLYRAYQGK